MYESLPDTQHGPDHQLGVQSVQAEGHPGCRDAVGSVQHVSGQRAGLRHDLLDGRVRSDLNVGPLVTVIDVMTPSYGRMFNL